MEEENKKPWWASSADPTRLAASIKGFLTLLVGISGVLGVDIPDTLVDEVVEVGVAGIGAAWMVFGLVRKIVIFIKSQ